MSVCKMNRVEEGEREELLRVYIYIYICVCVCVCVCVCIIFTIKLRSYSTYQILFLVVDVTLDGTQVTAQCEWQELGRTSWGRITFRFIGSVGAKQGDTPSFAKSNTGFPLLNCREYSTDNCILLGARKQ
jgi:hypothetical protein